MNALNYDEEVTAKTCKECKGEGIQRNETATTYSAASCRWCKGTGRIPVSGTYPKVQR